MFIHVHYMYHNLLEHSLLLVSLVLQCQQLFLVNIYRLHLVKISGILTSTVTAGRQYHDATSLILHIHDNYMSDKLL
jgi:hypothetical protein